MSDLPVNVVVSQKDSNVVEVGNQALVLELLDGFDDLQDRQKKYMIEYAKDPTGSRYFAAMRLGYRNGEIDKWFNQETFANVADTVYDIYTDILKGIDFKDALTNSKIRGRVIESRENGGKYSKQAKETNNNHIHFHGTTLPELLKGIG